MLGRRTFLKILSALPFAGAVAAPYLAEAEVLTQSFVYGIPKNVVTITPFPGILDDVFFVAIDGKSYRKVAGDVVTYGVDEGDGRGSESCVAEWDGTRWKFLEGPVTFEEAAACNSRQLA